MNRMDREQFNNHAILSWNAESLNLVNFLFDMLDDKDIAYFISVRNGKATQEFTIKAKANSRVIATVELKPTYGIDIELHIKCSQNSDIDTNVVNLIQKTYLG